jgi:hypothetical protein
MFESLTLITCSLILWFAWQLKSLGLTSTVPKDSGNRAHYFASQCLEVVKKELSGADITDLKPHSVEYHPQGGDQKPFRIWSEDGQTRIRKDGAAVPLHDKTGEVELNFEQLSAGSLLVKIAAKVGATAKHEVGVRLEAHLPAPATT